MQKSTVPNPRICNEGTQQESMFVEPSTQSYAGTACIGIRRLAYRKLCSRLSRPDTSEPGTISSLIVCPPYSARNDPFGSHSPDPVIRSDRSTERAPVDP